MNVNIDEHETIDECVTMEETDWNKQKTMGQCCDTTKEKDQINK